MATLFGDFSGGNDANDGTSFANRFKTMSSGATAARTAPGDTIRWMRSPAPVSVGQNASFTNNSPTVTLTTAVNATVDDCESGWTISANVTGTYNTDRRQGSNSLQLAVAAAFTTGKVAYKALGASTDFSAYEQLSFWAKQTSGTASHITNFRICLCSDTVGDVIVDSFSFAAIGANNVWVPMCINKAAALGNAIQSVAIYLDADNGAQTIRVDNIITVKAASANDSISHLSLIGKNTDPISAAWPIRHISGTTITLDMGSNSSGTTTPEGYVGTTESVTLYKRECILHPSANAALSTTVVDEVQEGGSAGSPITHSGGWDTTAMTTQEDYTFVDLRNGNGFFPYITGKSYVTLERIILVRGNQSVVTGTCVGITYTDMGAVDCYMQTSSQGVIHFDSAVSYSTLGWKWVVCNHIAGAGTPGVVVLNGTHNAFSSASGHCYSNTKGPEVLADGRVSGSPGNIQNNAADGLTFSACNGRYDFTCSNIKDNTGYAVAFPNGGMRGALVLRDLVSSGNSTGGINHATSGGDYLTLIGCSIAEATEVNMTASVDARAYSVDHDGVSGDLKVFTDGGYFSSETGADRDTASGMAWQVNPTSTTRDAAYPMELPLAQVPVAAGSAVTITCRGKRSNAGLTIGIKVKTGQKGGPATEQSDTVSTTSTYDDLSVSWTPSVAGVVEVVGFAYGGTTYEGHWDNMTFSQA